MNLSSRMKMVKARSKALPPDLTEVLNEVDRLQVGVRPMKDTEVDKAKDKMRQIVDVEEKYNKEKFRSLSQMRFLCKIMVAILKFASTFC